MNIEEYGWCVMADPAFNEGELTRAEVAMLYALLPMDLPTMSKELLIQMAAYDGNIDRYARLRRPVVGKTEVLCVIRRIYHHTMFARWLANELEAKTRILRIYDYWWIQRAINTRRFIDNDFLSANMICPCEILYCI